MAAADRPLLELFDLFANEALFGRAWLQSTLSDLPPGAAIAEVGAGLSLLSCQLVREGYSVSAIEPITDGFSSFTRLQRLTLEFAQQQGIAVELLETPVEELDVENRFDLAFSINVMEHVANVAKALACVTRSLKPGARYRFTCPNYLFPYEPHFNIPTLFSKALTERVFRRSIFQSRRVEQPDAIWRSLNWIDVPSVRRHCKALPGIRVSFGRTMTSESLERLSTDKAFAGRRSFWMATVARWLVATRLHRLPAFLPAACLPIIDCTVVVQPQPSRRGR